MSNCQNKTGSPHVKYTYKEINKFKKHAFKKYGVVLWGHGGGFMNQINKIDLSFYIKKEKSLDEMRDMIVNLANDFITQVNSNNEIKQYLVEIPFSSDHLKLSVALFDKNRKFILNSEESKEKKISLVSLIENDIYYKAAHKEGSPMQLICKETFQEAIEKVQISQIQLNK